MFTPAAKRRRLDDANQTLRKPFKSPALVRDRDPSNAAEAVPEQERKQVTPGSVGGGGGGGGAERRGDVYVTPSKKRTTTTTTQHCPFTLSRPQVGGSHSHGEGEEVTTPSGKAGGRRAAAAAAAGGSGSGSGSGSARTARQEEGREEVIRQAERIRGAAAAAGADEGPDGKEGLEGLVAKWRAASRMAAEEVFEGSKERVRNMGGMKGWNRARREFAEEERGFEGQDGAERGGDDDDEHEEFTMGTMLKSMNIDFDAIGYDEDAGWWRDG
ncbi:Swi5-dependent recombination DNA repair protein 1 [Colletotrichum sidae]|uniref:Swi5-dependent recombination DNA repair protein 1 n=1 Tax=Colletotrichum sidae TaxID=1347389 RepID=A0A4R8TUG6_9PEZI|nr:Swi5-dependent recombination DNA repair protein 1 [Colletotrichum sidae]